MLLDNQMLIVLASVIVTFRFDFFPDFEIRKLQDQYFLFCLCARFVFIDHLFYFDKIEHWITLFCCFLMLLYEEF